MGYLYIMKIMISEKQLQNLLGSEVEVSEQDATGSGDAPTDTGIPKFADRVGRDGPANQLGLTKWETVVGAKVSRGPGNPLWKKS